MKTRHALIALFLTQMTSLPAYADAEFASDNAEMEAIALEDTQADTEISATEETAYEAETADLNVAAAEAAHEEASATEVEIAAADEAAPEEAATEEVAADEAISQEDGAFDQVAAMEDGELNTARGAGFDNSSLLISTQNATVSNATVNGGVTGNNSVSDTAFNNFAGIGTVMQNSGNNVVMQSTFQLNVLFQ